MPPLTTSSRIGRIWKMHWPLSGSQAVPDRELFGEDLRLALRSLGPITGRVDMEDILDVVFREFCIGK